MIVGLVTHLSAIENRKVSTQPLALSRTSRPARKLFSQADIEFIARSGASAEAIRNMRTIRTVVLRQYARDIWRDVCLVGSQAAKEGSSPASRISARKLSIAWRMGQLYFAYGIQRIAPGSAGQIIKRVFSELELEFRSTVIPITTTYR